MKKYLTVFAGTIAATLMFGAGLVLATNPPGGGHEPITVCHKPGTPAEKELTFDNDALGQAQANAHLGHGDTLGPCQPVTTTTTTTTEPEEDILLLAGVTFTEATCEAGPSFTLVKTFLQGIGLRPFYSVQGTLVAGKPVAGESYTITALPVDGYYFEGQTVWLHTFAATPTNCGGETTTTEVTETTPTTPEAPCGGRGLPNPPGGKDGKPGNDECIPDPEEPTPPVETTTPDDESPVVIPPPVVPPTEPEVTTPEEEKPVAETPKAPKPTLEEELEEDLEKQAKENKKGRVSSSGAVHSANALPNTGVPLLPVAFLGALSAASGIYLRRKNPK